MMSPGTLLALALSSLASASPRACRRSSHSAQLFGFSLGADLIARIVAPTTVIKAGKAFEELAVNRLDTDGADGDSAEAAPARGGRVLYAVAADNDTIFLRTGNRLFCIR